MTCFAPRSLLSSFLSTLLVLHGLLAPVRAEAPALFGLDDIPLASARLTPPDPSSKLLGLGEIDLSRSRRWAALQEQVRPRAAELPELAGLEQPALDPHLERYIAQPLRQTGEHLSGLFSNEQQVAGVLEQIKQGGVDIEQKLVQAGEEKLQAMVDSGLDNVTQRLQGSILPQLELSYRAPFSGREELFHINATLLLWETSNHLLFNQGGLLLRDGEDGANLGLGYRFLAGEGLLLGVNTFYDWLSDPDVERWSVGAEARSAWLDLHGNWYQGRGNDRDGDTLYYSPDGWDIELAAHLPTVPWVELGASYYLWEGEGSQDDLEGYRYGLSLKPFTLWNIGLEYDDPDGNSGSWGVKADLNYQFGVPLSNQLALRGTQETPDLWSRRYEKIEREYAIRVRERRTGPAVASARIALDSEAFDDSADPANPAVTVEVPLPPGRYYQNTADVDSFRLSETLPGEVDVTGVIFNGARNLATLTLRYRDPDPITGNLVPITEDGELRITVDGAALEPAGALVDLVIVEINAVAPADPGTVRLLLGRSAQAAPAPGCDSGITGIACVAPPATGSAVTVSLQVPLTPVQSGTCPTCQIALDFSLEFTGTALLGADYTVAAPLTLTQTSDPAASPMGITPLPDASSPRFTVRLGSLSTHYLNIDLELNPGADTEQKTIQLARVIEDGALAGEQPLLVLEPMGTPYAELEEVTSPLTETNLNGATVTVTLTNAVYLPGLAAGDFRPLDTVQGTVSITGVSPDSATQATLTLGHSGGDINADGTLVVTVLDSAHSGSGNLNAGSVPLAAVAGVSVTPVAVTVGENGGTNTYTLVLDKQPTATVTLTPVSGDTAIATVLPASLSFTMDNWDTPQTVTVTGIDDAIDNASDRTATVTHTAASSDSDYNTVPVAAVTVTAADNDGVGVNVLPAAVMVNEDGGTNTYTLALASEPIADVTITPASGNTAIATVSPPTLSFTPVSWNTPQTVTVTGIDDVIDNPSDRTVPITHTIGSADSGYNGLPVAAVTVTATDDDDPGVSVSETALTVDENSDTGAYTVELDSQPTANVNLTLSSSALSVATVSPPTLSFTPSDWNVPQTVTVTGINDDLDNPVNRTATISHALSSSDASYSVLGVASVTVTALDDDIAGVSVDPTMLTVDENSGAGTYTVVLDSQPTANVSFTLASGDTTIAMVSPPTLSFTPSAWNVAQTVTVTGVNDDIVNPGDRTTAITHTIASADGDYDTLDVDSVDVIADDDDAGVRVTPTTLSVLEADGTGTYTLVLESEPTAGVTITLASGDTNIATVSLATLSFTTSNWNVAQTVTVTGVNDDIDNDPVRTTPIRHTTASSDDDYDTADVDDVVVTATDDDVAGVQVTPPALSVDESTGTGAYTLALASEPTGTVTITPTSGAVSVAMVSGALSFTPSNWNVAQTVTVTGVDDAIDNNPVRTATISHTISGGGYNAVPVTAVTVTADDDDTAGVSVDPTMLTVDENSGAGAYTVVLDSQPTANVSFTLASGDTTIAMVSPPTLSFTPSVWNVAQTVTVTGVNDDIVNPGDRTTAITHTIDSADGGYDTLSVASVDVIADDDDAGVSVSRTALTVAENSGTGSYTLVLDSQPTDDAIVTLTSGDTNIATVSPGTLSFTTANWNVAQTVTVTGVNDDIDNDPVRTAPIRHTTASSDDDYDAADVDDVVVSATDDDVAGVQVTPPALSVDESTGTGTYTLALASEPTGTVTITPTSGAVSVAMVSGALSFTPSNWNVAQTVTVTGVDDAIDNNPVRTATISHTISGGGYNAVPVTAVTVTADDDDTAGVSVDPTMLTVDENSGAGTYTVVLDSQPTANVSFTLASGDTTIAMVSPPTLSFTPSNWNVAQTVTVTGVNDDIINPGDRTTAITHTIDSADGGYDTLSVDSVDVIADDDDAGVSVSRTALTVAENSGTGSYTLVLDSQPTDDATVTLTSGDTNIATVSPGTLSFAPSVWNVEQTVTVTSVNDGIDNPVDRTVTISHTVASADGDYNGVDVDDVVVTSDDDDDPGVSVTPTTVTVAENRGTDTYTLVLDVVPTDSVTVTPASGDTNIATVSAALSFTTSNWNVAQTVTVTGVNDAIDNAGNRRTATITHALSSSGDPRYNSPAVTVADVSVSATDDDTASVGVAPATVTVAEDNGTDTYTVVLGTQPTGTVTITPASSADPVATVSGALSFTPSNWNVAQTVTVTGVNDNRVNASTRTATISHTISGGGYNSVPVADVVVSATDDDVAGVSVSETALTVDEGGGTGTYTLALESEPIGTVTITPASSAVPVATVSGALSFTPANWNVAQTVTVTGVNDNRVNASPRTATISHTISGGDYNSVPVADVGVSVTDNDVARVSIMPTALTVDEDGGTGTYTVVLDSQPTDDVSLTLASGDTMIAMVSPPTLSFIPAAWNVAQTVTVTGVNDDIINPGDRTTAITHTIDSADGDYGTLSVDSVDVTADDDDAGVRVTPTTLSVPENGGTGTYTLVLESEPTDGVTITLASGDTNIATVSLATLSFTTSNWNTAQTVTVTGINDDIDNDPVRTAPISHTSASSDDDYDTADVDDVVVTATDDDVAGVSVTPTMVTVAEGNGIGSYTVALGSQPAANVTITPASSAVPVATVSGALSFTPANWNVPQTVTVTGVNDDLDNASDRTATITHAIDSADGDYSVLPVDDVSVTATDDDVAGVSVVPTVITVNEDSGTNVYTVVLDSRPTAAVTITPTSGDTSLATVSGALSFAPAVWNVAQTVTVTGVDDGIENAVPRMTAITHAIDSTDGDYGSLDVDEVSVSGVSLPQAGLFSIGDDNATEGSTVDTANFELRLSLDTLELDPGETLPVQFQIDPAEAAADYRLFLGATELSADPGATNRYTVPVDATGVRAVQVRAGEDSDNTDDQVTVRVLPGTGYLVSSTAPSLVLTLRDNDRPVGFARWSVDESRSITSIREGEGRAVFWLQFNNRTIVNRSQVNLLIASATATIGADFNIPDSRASRQPNLRLLTIPAGIHEFPLYFDIVDDAVRERRTETVEFSLFGIQPRLDNLRLTIIDNELPLVEIRSARSRLFEGQSVRLPLRVQPTEHPLLEVGYQVRGVDAADFRLAVPADVDTQLNVNADGLSGTLTIPQNAGAGALRLEAVDDGMAGADLPLEFVLQASPGNVTVGDSLSVTLVDVTSAQAQAGIVEPSDSLTIEEAGEAGEVVVELSVTPATRQVQFTFVSGTPAPELTDYSVVSVSASDGTLSGTGPDYTIAFPASNSVQRHRLSISANADTDSATEQLEFRLSDPAPDSGYSLAARRSVDITLLDADNSLPQVGLRITSPSRFRESAPLLRMVDRVTGFSTPLADSDGLRAVVILGADIQPGGDGVAVNFRITGVDTGLGNSAASEIRVDTNREGNDGNVVVPITENGTSAQNFFTITIPSTAQSGAFQETFLIWATLDGITEGNETLVLEILPDDGYIPNSFETLVSSLSPNPLQYMPELSFVVEDASLSSAVLSAASATVTAVEGGAAVPVDLSLSATLLQVPVQLRIVEASGALAPESGDYQLRSAAGTQGTLESTADPLLYRVVFPPAGSSQTHRLLVSALSDSDADPERLTLRLESPAGSRYDVGTGQSVQIDVEDGSPLVSVQAPELTTLLEGAAPVNFALRLERPAAAPLPVRFSISGLQRADFTLTAVSGGTLAFENANVLSGTLTFAQDSAALQLQLRVPADLIVESQERFTFTLPEVTDNSYGLAPPPAVTEFAVDIEESLLPAVRFDLAASDLVATEGSTTDLAQLQIVLDPPATGSMPVNLPLEFRPPPAFGDYQVLQNNTPLNADTNAAPGAARYLLSGVNSGLVSVRVRAVADLDRTSERISVRLLPGAGFRFFPSGDLEAELSIQEAALMQLSLAFSEGSVEEGGTVMLSLRLSAEAPRPLQVGYRISGVQVGDFELFGDRDGVPGTASDDSVLLQDVLVLAADSATASYQLRISDDRLLEGTETLRLELLPSVDGSYGLGANSAELRIDDNDPAQVGFVQARPVAGEAAGTVALQVRSQPAPLTDLQVGYRFNSDRSNVALGVDFMLSGLNADNAGTLTLTPQAPQADITLTLVDDLLNEGPFEEALFQLQPPPPGAGYILGQQDTLLRIYDNEAPTSTPRVTFEQVESLAGEGGPARVQLRVEPPSGDELTVSYGAMPAGTAASGADYAALSGSLTVPPNAGGAELLIELIDDGQDEPEETLALMLANPVASAGYQLGDARTHLLRIQDAQIPALSFAPASQTLTEGSAALASSRMERTATISLAVEPSSQRPLRVRYRVSTRSSARLSKDYSGLPEPGGVSVWAVPANAATSSFSVQVLPDSEPEPDEQLIVELLPSDDGGYVLGEQAVYTLTIRSNGDDGSRPRALFGALGGTVVEGMAFEVPLQVQGFSGPLAVNVVAVGAATTAETDDYSFSGSLTLSSPGGEVLRVQTGQDSDNQDELLVLEFSASPAYDRAINTLAASRFVLHIDDNEPASGQVVQFEDGDSSVREPARTSSGPSQHRVFLTRSATAGVLNVSLRAVARGGAQSSGSDADDYRLASNTVRFNAGQARVPVQLTLLRDRSVTFLGGRVGINNEDRQEGDQTVELALLPGSGYQLGAQRSHRVRIADITFLNQSGFCRVADGRDCSGLRITEGDIFYFDTDPLSFGGGGQANVTAVPFEAPVSLYFCVYTSFSAAVSTLRGDNPEFLLLNVERLPGVRCDNITDGQLTQAYRVIIPAGRNSARVAIEIIDDDKVERGPGGGNAGHRLVAGFAPDPRYPYGITAGSYPASWRCNADSGDDVGNTAMDAICRITDNDQEPAALPRVGFAEVGATVDEAAGAQSLTVNLDAPSPGGLVVRYQLGGSPSLELDRDYRIDALDRVTRVGRLVVSPGDSSATLDFSLLDNPVPLQGERVLTLALQPQEGLYEVAGNTVYTLTIREDDEIGDFVQVRFAEAQLEVNEGSGSAELVVRAIPPPGIAISGSLEVEYRIVFSDTTALPADYTLASSGTLTLSDGNRDVTLPVGLIDDSAQDSLPSRELVVELVQPEPIQTYVVVPPQRATLVINDDDGANAPVPRVYFERADSTPEEGNTVMVRVVAVPPPTGELTVAYQRMAGGTATAGSDYRTPSGSLTIPAQQGSALLSVELFNNPEDEPEETLLLRLSPPSPSAGYTLGSLRDHLLRIQDAQVPAVSFASAGRTVTEAPRSLERGRINVLVEIGLTVALAPFQPLTVRYQVSGSAQQNQDYQGLPPNGAVDVLQIAASTTTHTLIVEVPPDELREGVETLVLELLDPLDPEDDSYRPGSEPVYTLTINDDAADGNLPQVLFGAADLQSVDAPVLEVNEGEFVDIPVQVSAFSGAFDLSLAVDGTQGNAESGDYTLPAATRIDAAAGTVRLQTNQDSDGDDEVLVLEFAPSAAYQTMPLLVRSNLVVYILDDEAPATGPVVQFAETSSVVQEPRGGSSPYQVALTRSGDTSAPLTVSLQAVGRGDVTAGNGDADADDYNLPSNMVTFAAGQSRTMARLDLFGNLRNQSPLRYDFSEGEQVVELALVAGGGYRLGDRRRHQVRIIDRIRPAGSACFLADGSSCCHDVGDRGCAVGGNTEIREGDIIYFEQLFTQPGADNVGATRGRSPILQMPIEFLYCVSTAGRPFERSSRVSHRRSDNPDFLILDAQPVNLGSDPYRGQCSGISGAQAYRVVGLPGQNRVRITMEIVDDNRVEGSDGNRLVAEFRPSPVTPVEREQGVYPSSLLCNSLGGTGEGANNPFCVVTDNDVAPVPLPTVGFSDTGGTVSEDGGMMRIPLDVSPASERGVVVDYALLPTSSALLNQDVIIDGVDGTLRGQVVLFGDGGEIQALLRDDSVRLGNITLILELRQRPGVYQIAADRNRYTLIIEDDD